MSARTKKTELAPDAVSRANEVRLVGRISQPPDERVLPSGDTVWTFRVGVPREEGARRTRQSVDAIDCAVWSGRVRRTVPGWRVDDVVEVTGSLRRRFFRAAGSAASRVELEVTGGRVIRRAATA